MSSETGNAGAKSYLPLWSEGTLDLALERQEMTAEIDRILTRLLPLLDGVEKLCRDIQSQPPEWVTERLEALGLLFDVSEEVAASIGLERTGQIGESSDAVKHQIASVNHCETWPRGAIIEVLQNGWAFRNRILRQALVTVSSGLGSGS